MNSQVEKHHRLWFLTRRLKSNKTLVFTVVVNIEEDEENQGSFCGTIEEMGDSVIAVENDLFKTEESTLALFRDAVDHCLEKDNLDKFLAGAEIVVEVALPFDKVVERLDGVVTKLREKLSEDVSSRPKPGYRATPNWLVSREPASIPA